MATKNYLDYTGLTTYDGLIKDYIGDNTGDSKNVTWEEYSQLPESEKKNSNIAYYITGVPDEESKKGYLGTASGELCTFTDGSDLPMPKLEVAIEPVQEGSGDPSPENIRPISGWDEVNVSVSGGEDILDLTQANYTSKSEYGVTITFNSDNSVTINGTTTAQSQIVWTFNYSIASNFRGKFLAGINDCTLLIEQASSPYSKWAIVEDGDAGKVISENINNAANLIIRIPSGKTFNNRAIKPIIYDVQTYTIDLDGTRYGGKVDLVSGVMTVDRMLVDMGTLNWSIVSWQDVNYIVSQTIRNVCVKPSSDNIKGNILCSNYPNIPRSSISTTTDKIISLDVNGNINVIDSNYATASDFTTAMNGVQFVYELATPLTIQLTPTVVKSLRGVNNVTTDVGGLIQLEYWRSGNVQLRMNDYVIAGGNTVAYADVAENIIQTPINTDSEYRILFSGSDDNTTKADSVGKNGGLLYNPNKNAITLGTRASSSVTGGGSFVLGGNNTASGNGSFIHGVGCTASGNVSHAIGAGSVASGNVSFAQGSGVTASGDISHAEGTNTEASNDNAHAEGYHSLASGPVSHAEGSHTVASGNISHAEGIGTIAQRAFNHVFGKYNVADTGGASTTGTGTYIEIVGNGTDDTTGRSNARTLDWSGNETLAGNLVLSGTNSDITLSGSGNTWDGTNTSLKQAITAAASSGGVVTQTASDSEVDYYELLFSSTADNTTRIESTRKAQSLLYSPSSKELRITNSDNSSMTKITNGTLEVKYTGSAHTPARVELALSSAAVGDGFTGTVQLGDTTGKFMLIGSKDLLLLGTGNTWDGTNTSLKDVITALSNRITALGG